MNEMVRIWLEQLYEKELSEVLGALENEKVWELGYSGDEMNPHTENIENLREYIDTLEELIHEVQ